MSGAKGAKQAASVTPAELRAAVGLDELEGRLAAVEAAPALSGQPYPLLTALAAELEVEPATLRAKLTIDLPSDPAALADLVAERLERRTR